MIDSNGSWTWTFRTATSRAARSDEALPTAPDRARTTHVAGASKIWSNSELLLRFLILFTYPPGICEAAHHDRRARIQILGHCSETGFISKTERPGFSRDERLTF